MQEPEKPVSQPPAVSGSSFDVQAFLQSFISTAREIVLSPQVFYGNMPTSSGFVEPILFFAVSCIPNVLMSTLTTFNPLMGILSILIAFIGSFAGAGLGFGLSKAMGGTPPSFEAVYRVFAYAGVVGLVTWVPFVGPLLGLYAIVLQYFGLKRVCGMSTGQTIAVCVISGILSLVIGFLVAGALMLKAILGI